jgi:hypothetical protein
MKYNPKNKVLEFSSEDEAALFHNQLTDLMRTAMNGVGSTEATVEEGSRLTREFFERYAVLTDTLCRLRAHLPRQMDS